MEFGVSSFKICNPLYGGISDPVDIFFIEAVINHWQYRIHLPLVPTLTHHVIGHFRVREYGSRKVLSVFMGYFMRLVNDHFNFVEPEVFPFHINGRIFEVPGIFVMNGLELFYTYITITKIKFGQLDILN